MAAKKFNQQQLSHTPLFNDLPTTSQNPGTNSQNVETINLIDLTDKKCSNGNETTAQKLLHPKMAIPIPTALSQLILKYPGNVSVLFATENVQHRGALVQERLPNPQDPWRWFDSDFVKLPMSPAYTKTKIQFGNKNSVTKWYIMQSELSKLLSTLEQSTVASTNMNIGDRFRSAVCSYNSQVKDMNFSVLNHPDVAAGFTKTLPLIVEEAVALQRLLVKPIPVLKVGRKKTIFASQAQICSLLANAFLCTIPIADRRNLPDINFASLFEGNLCGNYTGTKVEKMKCLLNYFNKARTFLNHDRGLISFERRVSDYNINWKDSTQQLSKVVVNLVGKIEDQHNCLQVDFANRLVGGGILSDGMVMEEIRFSICPELIVARLFTERLDPNEVLIITGVEQFSKYNGYGKTFKFAGNFDDKQDVDEFGRKRTQVVAMDAYNFKPMEKTKQYEISYVDRELKKCFCAFKPRKNQKHVNPIATGNWGCGAFNGDPELKFLIQWMAASRAGERELRFFTFGDEKQQKSLIKMYGCLRNKKATVGNVYQAIDKYYKKEICGTHFLSNANKTLFEYLHAKFFK